MVGAGDSARWNELSGKRPEAALHAVAHDRSADFLGDREADANGGVAVVAAMHEEDEARSSDSFAAIGGEEIGALAENV